MSYYFKKTVNKSVKEAREEVLDLLKEEGFGLITEVAMHEKFKEKLDVDYKEYYILGVCNPSYAYQALEMEEDLGLLLPCNVIVYDKGDGTSVVAAIDASAMMKIIGNEQLDEVSGVVNEHLERVINSL